MRTRQTFVRRSDEIAPDRVLALTALSGTEALIEISLEDPPSDECLELRCAAL